MKKFAISSLLGLAAVALVARAPSAAAQVQMDEKEFAVYDAANKTSPPAAQAAALEAYLQQFPNSQVKPAVLQQIMVDYSASDPAKTLTAADNVLKNDPNNLLAFYYETAFRRQMAEQTTDAATKTTDFDQAADFAQKGLNATKPSSMSDADWDKLKAGVYPTLYSAVGAADLNKKDSDGAIQAFKSELAATPEAQRTQPGQALQDTYYLGVAYAQKTPPDYVNCTFYATRAYQYAPAQYQAQMPYAQFCYKRYHGDMTGYDAVQTAAKANPDPPSGFSIVAAPSDADIAHNTVASTPDLTTLALSDREFILKYGKQEDSDKVFDAIKGKTTEIPGATVIKATADTLDVAVDTEAVQNKVADYEIKMKTPLTKVPDVGSKITVIGTYASYTKDPLLISMDNGEIPAAKTPARRPTTTRRPR